VPSLLQCATFNPFLVTQSIQGNCRISIHGGKWSLYLQNMHRIGTITLTARTDASLQLVMNPLWPVWCYASLINFLGSQYFVFSLGMPWPSNAPTSKSHVGWGLKTLEATVWDHGNRSNDLETADLTDSHADTIIPVNGDFWITLYNQAVCHTHCVVSSCRELGRMATFFTLSL